MSTRLAPTWTPPAAHRQAGVFTATQALAAGATPAQVRRRRETGAWVPVAGLGLTLCGTAVTPLARAHAAALTWADAVVGMRTAAALHGWPVADAGPVDVVVGRHHDAGRGIRPHQVPLGAGEVVRHRGVRITDRRRTAIDCLALLPRADAERLLAWVVSRGVVGPADLARAVRDRRGRWGMTQLRALAADAADGAVSAAERRLHRMLSRDGITGWVGNAPVEVDGRVVARADVLFARERVVVEVDGFAHHGRSAFQADRERQNRLVLAGYTVLRFTWSDLVEREAMVLAQIRAALDAASRGNPSAR